MGVIRGGLVKSVIKNPMPLCVSSVPDSYFILPLSASNFCLCASVFGIDVAHDIDSKCSGRVLTNSAISTCILFLKDVDERTILKRLIGSKKYMVLFH